ncbi:MAG: nucleoside/nucleotide kinase family protein [Burkholderiaceae bacterium]|nr:nucleoside/nucleotide kinase family protein [Burkholderiaceae bacterium]
MKNQIILKSPIGRLLLLLGDVTPRRIIIGLVGLPGSGKSTLAAKFVESVNERTNSTISSPTAVALSMDGFHLTKAVLTQFPDPAAALTRRGSPWTFDPAGLAASLHKLREIPYTSNTWPAFEHGVGDPVADAIDVSPYAKLIIVEGLYLLHREHGWDLTGLLDEYWYLDTSMEVAMERLVKRHMASWDFSREQALARLAINDRLNADIVLQSRERADYLVE